MAQKIKSISELQDIDFMDIALKQAKTAFKKGEIPVGAIIIDNIGNILSKAYNMVETKHCQSRHAEIIAIEKACKKINNFRLDFCTIYVTLEPCLMCLGLIGLSRIERLVYAAKSPIFGNLDIDCLPDLYKKHIRGITFGIKKEDSELLMKKFFNREGD